MELIDDIDSLWEIANSELEQIKTENKNEQEKKDEKKEKKNNSCIILNCKHENIDTDSTCMNCGQILKNDNLSRGGEWNNYKDDSGNYQKNTQRCDTTVDANPYSRDVGGSYTPFHKKSLIGKLQIQQTFSHKQKTYWTTGNQFEQIASSLNLRRDVIDGAKMYWYKYMESGKLTRASVRRGLIASCLFYSCIQNKVPIERDEIIKAFGCDTKTLSKGEKVLFEILEAEKSVYVGVQIEESNSFVRYCSVLKLPWKVSTTCNDLFEKYQIQMQAVSPKSAVGGILAYVVKYQLGLKTPNKTIISATVDVCTPTLNKVIQLLIDLEK